MEEEQLEIEAEALERLESIEEDLEEIKNRTPDRRKSFVYGFWHGVGALVGGILGLSILGWVLTVFGVVPGLDQVVPYLQTMVDNFKRP